jgi:hypothetical protein
MASNAFARPYLGEQLLRPFAFPGGGQFTTVNPSQLSRTAADIIAMFTGQRVIFTQQGEGEHLVNITPCDSNISLTESAGRASLGTNGRVERLDALTFPP